MDRQNGQKDSVYMDYNATTPLEPMVLKAIHDALRDAWGNPSSSYDTGQLAKSLIQNARREVAEMIGAQAEDVIFLSGGTEANNMVISTAIEHYQRCVGTKAGNVAELKSLKPHVIISNVEHDSVVLPVTHLQNVGKIDMSVVPVNQVSGVVMLEEVLKEVRPNTCLVSIMLANNEVGVIQPIRDITATIRGLKEERSQRNLPQILLHTDAAQAIGKISVNVQELGVDYLTVVGHKFYGPRIGALYARSLGTGTPLYPVLFGGGQERNFRPGTENTGMIAGLGQAAVLVTHNLDTYHNNMEKVRDYLESQLTAVFGENVQFNGKCLSSQRLPNTCNVSFLGKGLEGRRVLGAVKRLQASVGAACHTDVTSRPSPILSALGIPHEVAINAVRLSVGRETTLADVDVVIDDLKQAIECLITQS